MADLYVVVVNDEEQYSIWESGTPVPDGWSALGDPAPKERCLDEIETLWTDMRPASLRRWMQQLAPTAGDDRSAQAELVSARAVAEAAERVKFDIKHTDLIAIDSDRGFYIKSEWAQPTGTVELRAATNAVASLTAGGSEPELVVHCSIRHACSVAYAARRRGIKMTVVLPDDAPTVDVDAIRVLGSAVVLVPATSQESESRSICVQTGGHLVTADDFAMIAGGGTVGLEILQDLPTVTAILVPVRDGSLLAGVSASIRRDYPAVRVVGVEPELAAQGADSFRAGALTGRTSAQAPGTSSIGRFAWEHIRRYADDMLTVNEDAVRAAVAIIRADQGVAATPTDVLGLAACLQHRDALPPGPVVAIVSGGTVDPDALAGSRRTQA